MQALIMSATLLLSLSGAGGPARQGDERRFLDPRLVPAAGRFVLVGEEVSQYDRAAGGGTSVSTNYLTGVRVTKTARVGRGGRELPPTTRTSRVRLARRFIEEVDYERQ